MLSDDFKQGAEKYRKDFKKPPPPFSIRLSWAQIAQLKQRADGRPIGEYIKDVLFEEERSPKRTHGIILQDHAAFAKALGFLGKSRLANNVNQLARAANSGSLPLDDETKAAIIKAMRSIVWIRRILMKAMGLKLPEDDGGVEQ